MNNIVLFNMEG